MINNLFFRYQLIIVKFYYNNIYCSWAINAHEIYVYSKKFFAWKSFLLLSVPESKPKKVTFPDEDIVIFEKSLVDYNYIFLR